MNHQSKNNNLTFWFALVCIINNLIFLFVSSVWQEIKLKEMSFSSKNVYYNWLTTKNLKYQ